MKKNTRFLATKSFPTYTIGIDEAGRGPWAGPVVAAAVFLNGKHIQGVNDSKKLSEQKREELFVKIMSTCVVGVGIVDATEIDTIGIKAATNLAMNKAIENIPMTCIELLIIDGNDKFQFSFPHHSFVRGDSLYEAIAAASVVAKVTRDHLMKEYEKQYPHFAFGKHKGYGTKLHQEELQKFGVLPIHRATYKPIAEILLSAE